MNIDMDTPTEIDSEIFNTIVATINHTDRLTDDEIECYSMGACLLLLNHYPFADIRQRWLDNPTDDNTVQLLYGAIIAASAMDPHMSANTQARFYQIPRPLIDQARAL